MRSESGFKYPVRPGTGMETFAGVPRQARLLTYCRYEVKIVSPRFVKPFIKTNKTDATDAQAIDVAMGSPHYGPTYFQK